MVKSFVFVQVDTGSATDVVAEVAEIGGVEEAHVVAGNYDVVLEMEASEVTDLYPIVSERVRMIGGVEETRTYIELG
jgi:DNA-binding Lrp family transcriptional regulator